MKKKILGIGLALLLVCSVFVYADFTGPEQDQKGFGNHFRQMQGCKGFPEMDKETIKGNIIEHLGLDEDTTMDEIIEAKITMRFEKMKEKLGIPDNATEEEIKEAMKERMGNKPFRKPSFRNKRRGLQ